ncbi:hypothetical protein [Microbacterium sp. 10M-3C3]|uniref:hypothetical protein n=1 Tax=Microbacterium sp. 10M-3C3 TaxID=2483401 RepID=UPI000F63A040|nr:hypothetical protein [Microbacterium sp. 10M-3C3]
MSGIDIRSGGAIAVDSASLVAAAVRLRRLGADAADDARTVLAAARAVGDAGVDLGGHLGWAAQVIAGVAAGADDLAARVERAAIRYETVELLVAAELARAACDPAAERAARARLDELRHADPLGFARAVAAFRDPRRPGELSRQVLALAGTLGGAALSLAGATLLAARVMLDRLDRGAVPASARLGGVAPPVAVTPTRSVPVAPPASLADAAARIPGGGAARVRVEKYARADGTAQFAVYIAGTQAGGGDEPFDMDSNLALYTGGRSASYEAVVDALAQAGAGDGASVMIFGHSQGAMIGERLALEGGFETPMVVSFGSPIEADLGADTLAVRVRHTDDPVAALQNGGLAGAGGAAGSFLVERTADPAPAWTDLALPAHAMTGYVETARLVDASADPRVAAMRRAFDGLAVAPAGMATEYAAVRVSPRGDAGAG